MLLALSRLDSPVGRLVFAADDSLLRALEFYESEEQLRAKVERSLPDARFAKGAGPSFVIDALAAYFGGDGLGVGATRIFDGKVYNLSGAENLYLATGDGTSPVRIHRATR